MQQLDLVHVRVREDRETNDITELRDRVSQCAVVQKHLRLLDVAGFAGRKEIAMIGGVDIDARRNMRHHPHLFTVRARLG